MDAWPPTLSDRALRRRATCEMLRGNCEKGRRLLELARRRQRRPRHAARELPGGLAAGRRRADRRGQRAGRRGALRGQQAGAAPGAEAGAAAPDRARPRSRPASATGTRRARAAGGWRRWRAPTRCSPNRSWSAGDCAEGAALDVMHSQVKFQSFGPDGGDPALRCRSERVFAAYKSCADAGEAAERRCLARVQAAKRDGAAVLPDVR